MFTFSDVIKSGGDDPSEKEASLFCVSVPRLLVDSDPAEAPSMERGADDDTG